MMATHPLRGATPRLQGRRRCRSLKTPSRRPISIHAPLAGRDFGQLFQQQYRSGFQSTHPLRGATCTVYLQFFIRDDFNPRTPCGARRPDRLDSLAVVRISIHAPLAGRDCRRIPQQAASRKISIHAPLAGRDLNCSAALPASIEFQSTHPLRGATEVIEIRPIKIQFQSTHPLRGATSVRLK